MNISEILTLPVDQQIRIFSTRPDIPKYSTLEAEYNPEKHKVFDTNSRPYKTIKRTSGTQDANGNEIYTTTYEDVNRIAVPFQQIIVERAIGFLFGNPVKLKSSSENDSQELLTEMIERTFQDNKTDYFNHKLARVVMSQCEAAELWYFVEDRAFWKRTIKTGGSNIFKLRVKLLTPEAGDKLYPYFDETGDLIAFSRGYETTDDENRITLHFDTWTDTVNIARTSVNGQWIETRTINVMGKIPVIYYWQSESEWNSVQSLIDRYETKMSNFADTNDYFGSPMVKVIGEVASLPDKTTSGKVIQLTAGSSADYMSWNSAPESERLEFEQLEKMIYAMTQTPNISFEQMKSIGGDLSGFAIKLMFTDAHLKSSSKIELFGEMFQRRINLIQHVCGNVINVALSGEVDYLFVEPVFTPYLPKNIKEEIEILATARANKPLISQQTAIEQNPLAASPDEEIRRMEEDTNSDIAITTRELTGTFNL